MDERSVWMVTIKTPMGPRAAYVLARTAADAGEVLGNAIRAEHGFEPGEESGLIQDMQVRVAPDALASSAINA